MISNPHNVIGNYLGPCMLAACIPNVVGLRKPQCNDRGVLIITKHKRKQKQILSTVWKLLGFDGAFCSHKLTCNLLTTSLVLKYRVFDTYT